MVAVVRHQAMPALLANGWFTLAVGRASASLSEEIRKMEEEMIGAEKWVELIKENVVPKELTATLLNTMIEKILIHAPEIDDNGERTQEIEIYYRFIGKID